jgi:hypothetical protein
LCDKTTVKEPRKGMKVYVHDNLQTLSPCLPCINAHVI